jgi:hypothetical protein
MRFDCLFCVSANIAKPARLNCGRIVIAPMAPLFEFERESLSYVCSASRMPEAAMQSPFSAVKLAFGNIVRDRNITIFVEHARLIC